MLLSQRAKARQEIKSWIKGCNYFKLNFLFRSNHLEVSLEVDAPKTKKNVKNICEGVHAQSFITEVADLRNLTTNELFLMY